MTSVELGTKKVLPSWAELLLWSMYGGLPLGKLTCATELACNLVSLVVDAVDGEGVDIVGILLHLNRTVNKWCKVSIASGHIPSVGLHILTATHILHIADEEVTSGSTWGVSTADVGLATW